MITKLIGSSLIHRSYFKRVHLYHWVCLIVKDLFVERITWRLLGPELLLGVEQSLKILGPNIWTKYQRWIGKTWQLYLTMHRKQQAFHTKINKSIEGIFKRLSHESIPYSILIGWVPSHSFAHKLPLFLNLQRQKHYGSKAVHRGKVKQS